MPTYDYKCPECGHMAEIAHSLSETPSIVCPTCSTTQRMKRMLSAPATVFKGQGFASNER